MFCYYHVQIRKWKLNKLPTGTKCFINDDLDVNTGPFAYDNDNASGLLQEIFAIIIFNERLSMWSICRHSRTLHAYHCLSIPEAVINVS